MRKPLKQWYLILLALLVGLLPFSFSYGVAQPSITKIHMASMDHPSPCMDQSGMDHCPEAGVDTPAHDDCCSDHCDSSFGGQLFVAVQYGVLVPRAHHYRAHRFSWVSGPVPPTLLHPPRAAA
ncbi:MAG: hypothetical protein OQL28_09095 [Sedimenticola sp.]|nr:hypothetical protein [Sedimenticola sp.]